MSVQRLLANQNNAVTTATVAASSIAPATQTVFRRQTIRQGNGQVALSGGYVGQDDATFQVEIRAASGTTARVSQPIYAGAGNGTMTQPTAVDGTASQTLTVTLADLGTETTRAQAVIYGDVLLRAKTAGTAGNSITLIVTTALTLSTDPVGALGDALKKDTSEWSDQRLDFGSVPLSPDGSVPTTAPRLVFGRDTSRVYRHYKRWDGEQWQYGVTPKLSADYAINSSVYSVSGTYSVTITDGVTPETYASLTTLYSLLSALSTSALTEVVGIVANDRKPGGAGIIDLPIRTAAFALPIIAKAPERMPDLADVVVSAVAPTETCTLECTANTPIGREKWAVKSRVAGPLPPATTGRNYVDNPYVSFTVPVVPRTASPIDGRIAISNKSFPRTAEQTAGEPDICLYRPVLGAQAANKTLTLIWTQRPGDAAGCNCSEIGVNGRPSAECLGINIEGVDNEMAIDPNYQTRLQSLYAWRATFAAANTGLGSGRLYGALNDLNLADAITDAFSSALADGIWEVAGARTAWDTALTAMQTDLTSIAAQTGFDTNGWPTGAKLWANGTSLVVGDYVKTDRQDVSPVAWKVTSTAVETASGLTVTRVYGGTVTITDQTQITQIVGQPYIDIPTASSRWPDSITDEFIDIGYITASGQRHYIQLKEIPPATQLSMTDSELDAFVRRYIAKMDEIRAIAGIVPKSDAGREGSACWRDPGDAFYWKIDGTEYLPVFNNVYYHSVIEKYDVESGRNKVVSTYEFGFGIQVACEDRLLAGDSITITIGEVSADYPYQIGDTYEIPIVAGGPLAFSGGITGTDALTWTVASTVGAFPNYSLTPAEPPYSSGGIVFSIHRGALAFALGDSFTFGIETGGRFRWRKDSGGWSGDNPIFNTVALAEGLSAAFVSGAAPNFVVGDVYEFNVRQPYSPNHVKSAHGDVWRWSGSSATCTLTWTADQTIAVVGLLRHGLISPATVSIVLKNSGGTTLQTLAPTVGAGPLISVLASPLTTVRSIEITVANATDLELGWVYAGVPLATAHNAAVTLRRVYALDRGEELNPRGTYLGSGRGGEIRWENWLLQDEFDALLALVDACKLDDDAPVVLMPHVLHPNEAALVRIDTDALEATDILEYQPNDSSRRRISLTLPFAAVIA